VSCDEVRGKEPYGGATPCQSTQGRISLPSQAETNSVVININKIKRKTPEKKETKRRGERKRRFF
jgi:hypothetical protein